MQADFSNFTTSNVGAIQDGADGNLGDALTLAKSQGMLKNTYQVHLWNACTGSGTNGTIDACGSRQASYVFDPVQEWGLNATTTADAVTPTSSASNVVQSEISNIKNNTEAYEQKLLGEGGAKALDAYRKVAKWMFIAYEVAFWTTLGTIVVGILAIFSRWGSLFTWILSVVSLLAKP